MDEHNMMPNPETHAAAWYQFEAERIKLGQHVSSLPLGTPVLLNLGDFWYDDGATGMRGGWYIDPATGERVDMTPEPWSAFGSVDVEDAYAPRADEQADDDQHDAPENLPPKQGEDAGHDEDDRENPQ